MRASASLWPETVGFRLETHCVARVGRFGSLTRSVRTADLLPIMLFGSQPTHGTRYNQQHGIALTTRLVLPSRSPFCCGRADLRCAFAGSYRDLWHWGVAAVGRFDAARRPQPARRTRDGVGPLLLLRGVAQLTSRGGRGQKAIRDCATDVCQPHQSPWIAVEAPVFA